MTTSNNNILVFIILFLLSFEVFGQIDKLTVIDTKLNKGDFVQAGFPFDEEFEIQLEIPANCVRMKMSYMLDNNEERKGRKWIVFPPNNSSHSLFQCDEFTRSAHPSATKYAFHCPGIHPNMHYVFNFDIFNQIVVDDKTKQELKTKLSKTLTRFGTNFSDKSFVETDLVKLNSDLNEIVTSQFIINCKPQVLVEKCSGTLYKPDIRTNLRQQFESFTRLIGDIQSRKNNLLGRNGELDLFKLRFKNIQTKVASDLLKIINNEVKLTPTAISNIKAPFNSVFSDFKDVPLIEAIKLLSRLLIVEDDFYKILSGQAKISSNQVVSSNTFDFASIDFLANLFNRLAIADVIVVDNSGNISNPFLALAQLNLQWELIVSETRALDQLQKSLSGLIANFPDITLNLLTFNAELFETMTLSDVLTQKSPYISAEGGLGYATAFQTAFSYYGANFYFSPVNKRAKLNRLKGINKLSKIMCVQVGLASLYGDRKPNSYSLLGSTSSNDLLLGFGLRAGRVLKINLGWIPYKTNNFNTLSDVRTFQTDFIVSLGIDINLLGGISTLMKGLKITN